MSEEPLVRLRDPRTGGISLSLARRVATYLLHEARGRHPVGGWADALSLYLDELCVAGLLTAGQEEALRGGTLGWDLDPTPEPQVRDQLLETLALVLVEDTSFTLVQVERLLLEA